MISLDASIVFNIHIVVRFAIAFSVVAVLAYAAGMRIARYRVTHAGNMEIKVFKYFIKIQGVIASQRLIEAEEDFQE